MQRWLSERGERLEREPRFDAPPDARRVEQDRNRVIFDLGGGEIVVRHDETERLRRRAEEVYYDRLPNGFVRTTIERPGGVRIVTIEDRYGNLIERTRIERNGRQVVLFSAPREYYDRRERGRDRPRWRDPAIDLPPIQVTIPRNEYVLEAERADRDAYYRTLERQPVQHVDRTFSIEDVRYSERVRDLMPRIDLNTINFDTGSAQITRSEVDKLSDLAYAMERMIDDDPAETFLIEGHTDAVGSDNSNLALSDRRAESVASALTEVYGIPPENLVTQGYGEQYLKINTQAAERQNRRVTVRRITPLVNPVASGG
ncbi:OmpA/MotB [Lutibaculum baratangense AMV1]|uniref:OmpA/MotB n=2 Tax=Lutibaculum TaxID=1358438 RepID=V4RBU0_9HYPH|nr:OmpA/MotB [Lutibaculum baratangense AMV1]